MFSHVLGLLLQIFVPSSEGLGISKVFCVFRTRRGKSSLIFKVYLSQNVTKWEFRRIRANCSCHTLGHVHVGKVSAEKSFVKKVKQGTHSKLINDLDVTNENSFE